MAFSDEDTPRSTMLPPLPERMRPADLDGYVGQRHLIGPGSILRTMIESGNLSSFILWGPPGVGKTTLAHIIAKTLDRDFYQLSAVSSGVKDVRDVIDKAKSGSLFASKGSPILFIDEIHRFNKAQQDALLGAVEDGTIQTDTLLKHKKITVKETDALFRFSAGDARKLLNILEIVVDASAGRSPIVIDNKHVTECLQENVAIYDKGGEMHYDIISAFIKSVRGSDPNAAVYYLARMLKGGEDPLFIARRLCILAAEDIGLANPNALLLANACFQVVHSIGMPEARIPLSETTIYLASSPKSNSAYLAVDAALSLADKTQMAAVPLYLRNAPTQLMEELGYADGYKYAHDFPGHFADLEFMPDELKGTRLYEPQPNKHEESLKAYLKQCWPKYYSD